MDGVWRKDRIVERMLAKFEQIQHEEQKNFVLALNKVDLVEKKDTFRLLRDRLNQTGLFKESFIISALSGYGVEDLRVYGRNSFHLMCSGLPVAKRRAERVAISS